MKLEARRSQVSIIQHRIDASFLCGNESLRCGDQGYEHAYSVRCSAKIMSASWSPGIDSYGAVTAITYSIDTIVLVFWSHVRAS